MEKYLLKKRIFAIVFIVVVFGYAAINFWHSFEPLKECLAEDECSITEVDSVITKSLYGRMNFIETHAYIQTLLDKRECNNFSYIKDEAGFLHYSSFFREEETRLFEYALRVKRLQDSVERKGTKVLFVVPPSKYNKDFTQFRKGLSVNNPDCIIDEMIFYLNRLDVETLDLRECIPNDNLHYEEAFFKTDHHWTIPAAFYATKELVDKIEECFGENLDPTGYYTDINNYDLVTYKSGMLGSMGRKTGVNFSGIEDFTALWPHFTGDYYRKYCAEIGEMVEKEGTFTETLMNTRILTDKSDIYSDSQYSLYLNSITYYEKLVNKNKPNGCRIFMIRDSYFSPVMTFMIPMCGEISALWSMEKTEEFDIEKSLQEDTYDYVIIEVYPYNINSDAFNYFKEDLEN